MHSTQPLLLLLFLPGKNNLSSLLQLDKLNMLTGVLVRGWQVVWMFSSSLTSPHPNTLLFTR